MKFTIGTQIDGLAVALLVVVTIISGLVHVYSLEYVRGDRRFTHYYAALSLFTAGMLNLVVAENTVQLLLGWEIMGLCSFMLIGHWWEDKKNSDAALKAFFTTRTATSASSSASWSSSGGKELPDRGDQHLGHVGRLVAERDLLGRAPSSSASSASRASSHCTHGSPTPWPARRRCPH